MSACLLSMNALLDRETTRSPRPHVPVQLPHLREVRVDQDDVTEIAYEDSTEVPTAASPDLGSDDVTELPGSVDTASFTATEVSQGVEVGARTDDDPLADYNVDGVSGATLTGNGVTNMMTYWLGDHGFGPYLQTIQG